MRKELLLLANYTIKVKHKVWYRIFDTFDNINVKDLFIKYSETLNENHERTGLESFKGKLDTENCIIAGRSRRTWHKLNFRISTSLQPEGVNSTNTLRFSWYRCKSGISFFTLRVTWHNAYSLFKNRETSVSCVN